MEESGISANFAFDLEDMRHKDEFLHVGLIELESLVCDVIKRPGKYCLILTVKEIKE